MQSHMKLQKKTLSSYIDAEKEHTLLLRECISEAWGKIAPSWPLNNLVSVNSLQGLSDFSFEDAITMGHAYFQQSHLPPSMEEINRETIKWCQAFFDEGQATINMPFRDQGLYQAWRQLALFDDRLHQLNNRAYLRLKNLPISAEQTINECLFNLNIPVEKRSLFLTLLLTTLPGWASYIKYRTEWDKSSLNYANPVTQMDYLAIRITITYLLWPKAIDLINWHKNANKITTLEIMNKIITAEKNYQLPLLNALSKNRLTTQIKNELPIAQFVFCIDVRSEPFRRALEAQGNYETLGFAGFFGIPTQIKNELTEEFYISCPVLLTPKHIVKESLACSDEKRNKISRGKKLIKTIKSLYQGLKYTFSTPFALVEALGPWCGLWMSLRTISPTLSTQLMEKLFNLIQPAASVTPILQDKIFGIDLRNQCTYAENALRMMGLIDHFSALVILCGHGSMTQNNAYASALDCGACGGHHGSANARILAGILNNIDVRKYLAEQDILIPSETKFIAALHNTTTDEVTFYLNENEDLTVELAQIKNDLAIARKINNQSRCKKMGYSSRSKNKNRYVSHIKCRSRDWSQIRPEWGLARNASFIIGPRQLTKQIDLEGRAFLHSYNWHQDKNGVLLTTILTAPMIVAQWINSQYLFSCLDNIAYGSGSKITHNITGKIGIMQGNASDLMTGLPLQSLFINDKKAYHEPIRLMTIVYAPRVLITNIISKQAILRKLFRNGWVSLVCIEPDDGNIYLLQQDLTWNKSQSLSFH